MKQTLVDNKSVVVANVVPNVGVGVDVASVSSLLSSQQSSLCCRLSIKYSTILTIDHHLTTAATTATTTAATTTAAAATTTATTTTIAQKRKQDNAKRFFNIISYNLRPVI